MKSKSTYIIIVFALATCGFASFKEKLFTIPQKWPKPLYPFDANPLTAEKIALGRKLFYDPVLSRDSTISCSSCHLSFTAFTHVDHKLSHGIEGRVGIRNSPALFNLAWQSTFMWDGAINHLDVQALAPISNPLEMDESLEHVLQKLSRNSDYRGLFRKAFGDDQITSERTLKALSQFMLTIVSSNSWYDKVSRKEKGAFFNEQQLNGYSVYKSNCATCHPEPLFSTYEYATNGLPLDSVLNDHGRIKISLNEEDDMKFKIPSLRNIGYTFPYMHDGRMRTLNEVVKYYGSGPQGDSRLPLAMNEKEQLDLLAFLLTLNDSSLVFDQRFGYPR